MASDDRFAAWVAEGLTADALFEPSQGALRQAIALGSTLHRGPCTWFALLSFDSAAAGAPAGVRQFAAADRRLLFRLHPADPGAPEHELDLHLRRLPDRSVELTGQLLPPLPGTVVHVTAGRRRRRQTLGEGGDFLVRRAAAAGQRLEVRLETVDGREIRLAELDLDPDPRHDS